ncbi:hypothetical protein L0U85_11200 [Glycomyces sp. L485]|uniref:hypothetical protein n=1 Tax=Glycomyces sp. L485 TaxID=2909235 RepID=UPI001F4ADD6D|nr:hypothetical protein [Glycomyces sp. L485]MCH7231410.1 hypothetical protein [Glycomyces sp. L485]
MSISDAKAQLQQAVEHGEEASRVARELMSKAEEAAGTTASAAQDSSHDKPGEAIGLYQQAREKAEEAMQSLTAANAAVQEYIGTI